MRVFHHSTPMCNLTHMKSADVIRRLEVDGWAVARRRGSHVTLKKDGVAHLITVPVHGAKDLTPGVLKSIERASGLRFP
ncbi:MAG TPA: type II toxin-antitoxin system HicA family toxin [Caulobacteraceae bacterium]|nr:type II toxin-antitoxin system HicA family toxin [Caulobacteraceae bacterium]